MENLVNRARVFAQALIAHDVLESGENALSHADAVVQVLQDLEGAQSIQAASYLAHAWRHLAKPLEVIEQSFGSEVAKLSLEATQLVHLGSQALTSSSKNGISPGASSQTENVRKMLLAFSRDLRVVLLRLSSRLQTLRFYASIKSIAPPAVSAEVLTVYAPLANRLGIWQIKWELEDLALRFTEPEVYSSIAKQLQIKRTQRKEDLDKRRARLQTHLVQAGIDAQIQARPKHIYSILKKMRGKNLSFDEVLDVRAMRIIVPDVAACYAALSRVHEIYAAMDGEMDDYIARPKSNGYQSLHTVVQDEQGKPIEIQIRTEAMHAHAETGVAAHWAYKEAGAKGYAGVSASGAYESKIAVLRELLAWQKDVSGLEKDTAKDTSNLLDDRIYVFTPEATIVDLPQGATPVDFAYAVHTNLGHRCRGARIDGQLLPLNTALKNGQTIEITAAKEGGPSRDWLNSELHFLASPRARSKVRAWFNALQMEETLAKGREAVEKLLQREGKTALKLDGLAEQLGLKSAEKLFEVVGKDELSVRTIEQFLRPSLASEPNLDELILQKKNRMGSELKKSSSGSVLVVGVDSLLTQLAKCCKPAPPDVIVGYVTRGRGVSIHRQLCTSLKHLMEKEPDRQVDVAWGAHQSGAKYLIDLKIKATSREGLLRDITEIFNKEKIPVRSMQQSVIQEQSLIALTLELSDTSSLPSLLAQVSKVQGVHSAKRV